MPFEFYSTTPTQSGQGFVDLVDTTPTTLPAQPCNELTIVNTTGTNLYASKNGFASYMKILPNTAFTFVNVTNANEIIVAKTTTGTIQTFYNWSY